ncbi:MAG: 16S rRNA (adenine(1518)-N(6)/adenine(1519)-N(6))-dimethyltransferase RsmA [Chthoniobacterales bacterium]
MKLSEIDRTLREIRVSPVKSLGQNFLHDQNLARLIVERAGVAKDDFVVEIGPGLGALTAVALESGARVLAIEKDARLAAFLGERFRGSALEVIHADALEFDLRPLFAERNVKLIANLPYYVSSQLVLKFTAYPSPISLWLLMLQKEMARRISAQPRSADYGALTLLIQLHCRVEYLRTVPAAVFVPQPEVDSALVRITPRRAGELPAHHPDAFRQLVRTGFSQRRKQLQKLLRDRVPDWEQVAARCRFDPKARAEELSLGQWIELSNLTTVQPADGHESGPEELFAVVDEKDRETGAAPRREVHANNLLHRAVHILIFNRHGEIFLQKRSPWKDRHPLLWDSSAAGHVAAGEKYGDAARRELLEELGVEAELEQVAKLPASEQTGQEFICIYRGTHEGPFELAAREIEFGDFFAVNVVSAWIDARPYDFAPGFLECWRALPAAGN